MNHHVQKNPEAEQHALAAVEHHHGRMLAELQDHVTALIQAVENLEAATERSARDELLAWCRHELVPHALAEEGPLYSGPKETDQGRLLVEGMLAEHKVIVGLVDRLGTTEGVQAAVTGAAIKEIFALHLEKENRLLMPFIVQSPELSLADAVQGLHELVGREHGTHPH